MKKLVLHKETLRRLTAPELEDVVGGTKINDCGGTTNCETDPACDKTCKSAIHDTVCV